MINRANWKLTKEYLDFRVKVDQISGGSLKLETTYIRHILIWAGSTTFQKVYKIRPTLPEYLLTARLDGKEGRLSQEHIKKNLAAARRFFIWLSENYSDYRGIKAPWINTLKPKRINNPPKTIDAVTVEEMFQIASAPAENLMERRIKAAACFWFLSGVRIGAFVSLPIKAIDIENRMVMQYPNMGVRTKNRKYGITYLWDIPELLAVVLEWDQFIRSLLSGDGFWFAPFSPDTCEIDINCLVIGEHRETIARKNLKHWLQRVGLQYHSPHKFRHGHIQYGIANAKTIADFKAVSLNVLHSSMDITDEVYSRLGDQEIRNRINTLSGGKIENREDLGDTYSLFQEFLTWMNSRGNNSLK